MARLPSMSDCPSTYRSVGTIGTNIVALATLNRGSRVGRARRRAHGSSRTVTLGNPRCR